MPQDKPTLLLECLQHVLSFLRFNQLPTLYSLLTVNKAMFQLTLPILYLNPFVLVYDHRRWSEDEKTRRLAILMKLFLNEVEPSTLSALPPCVLQDDDDDEEEQAGSVDGDRAVGLNHQPRQAQQVRGYLYHYRRHDHSFLAEGAIRRYFGAASRRQAQTILAELDLIFLAHCGPRVLSLCLAAPRTASFEEAIPSLCCLRRLEIQHIEDVTETTLKELVAWIRKHDSIHGTLRELQLGGSTMADGNYEQGHFAHLVQLPQAFRTLHTLDTRSWREAWSMVDEIPVENLSRLVMDYGEGQRPRTGYGFLFRCKELKVLDLYVAAPDTFAGLSNAYRTRHHSALVSTPNHLEASTERSGTTTMDASLYPPPVERLYLSGHHTNLRNALEDATVGLCQTLRILKATSMARHEVTVPSLTWGRPLLDIRLPFLQELQLQGDIALEFHFSLLRCCPQLQSLKLLVNGLESCQQEGNPLEEILHLHGLQTLQLLGRWPLTMSFIRGIVSNLTGMKMLDLARCYGVDLDSVMKEVHTMDHLWRLGWFMAEVEDADELVARWSERAPRIRIGDIHWNEFYS
ncbi:hypothetical protein BGZ70_004497 [Mortierella alpina]|uniref:Uncharacterized protein n=1 Tax=Mortierella alpina TaxID=64518 RepID=A0A9P6LV51_MORAP|nr:hypothetical protein BGZ70_004497 [Mortierella alpina]